MYNSKALMTSCEHCVSSAVLGDGTLQVELVGGQVLATVVRFSETLVLALASATTTSLKQNNNNQ